MTYTTTLSDLQERAFMTADEKGFHGNWKGARCDALALLALVHTEVSEATQEVKRHWPMTAEEEPSDELRGKIGEELADVLIRIFDFAGLCSIDLQAAVLAKMDANERRPRLYGTPDAGKADMEEAPL